MFSDGIWTLPAPRPRAWPPKIHLPWLASPVLSKRLAKMLLLANPGPAVLSYQVAQGTVRPVPAKSIAGASPLTFWLKFNEPLNVGLALDCPLTVPMPRVVQAPPAKDRTKIWSLPGRASCWRKIAHGTATLPAVSAPPTTSALAG